jgi:imidazolonepropionase-like amidohydrolase
LRKSDLGGNLDSLDRWRHEIAVGQRLGLRILRAGPFVDGPKEGVKDRLTVTNAAEARAAVDSLKRRGVDLIKVHNALPRDAFFAVADEARRQGLPLAVHLPRAVSSAEASDAGARSLEHIETLIESALYRQNATAKTWQDALEENRGEAGAALFARFVRNGTWYVPTLVAYYRGFALWGQDTVAIASKRRAFLKLMDLAATMHRAGVAMMAGSDFTSADVGILPGADLHQELAFLVEAGFSPMEALQAATLNPARYFGGLDSLGTIEKGKIADLVLLTEDPLDNINNTRTIDTVVLGGRIVPIAALRAQSLQTEAGGRRPRRPPRR